MVPEYRFPLKRKRGFLHIGTSVSNLRNWGVKPSGILSEGTADEKEQSRDHRRRMSARRPCTDIGPCRRYYRK